MPGRGEIGVDLSRQFNQRGLFNKVTSETFQRRHPCYLLSLSPPTSVHTLIDSLPGRPSTIQTLLADAVREIVRSCRSPKIDRKRIYLTGFSYGGAAVYGLMTSFPELFACGIPVATFPPPPMFAVYPFRIWHLYNEGDYQAHRLSGTMLAPFADALTNVGGEFRSGTFAAAGHDAWRAAWNEDAVWEWAFAQGVKKSKFASESTNRATVVLKSSTSVASVALHGPDRAIDGLYGTWFESKRPAQRGDYLMVDFGSPIRKRISVFGWRSADIPPPRLQISVSRIGKSWTRIGLVSEKTGERSFVPASAVRFLRVAVDSDSSAPLRIREVRVSAP